MSPSDPAELDEQDPPPVLGRWRNVYLLLVLSLGAVVAVLYAATRWAS